MSHVTVLRKMPDGSLRCARPAYMFQDPKLATQKLCCWRDVWSPNRRNIGRQSKTLKDWRRKLDGSISSIRTK